MEEINYNQLKGRIERDEDWREGMDAFRAWATREFEDLRKQIKELENETTEWSY